MKLSIKSKSAVAALSLCLTAPWALAEDEQRWFQVEALIFENPDYGSESPEQWPSYPELERRLPFITLMEKQEDSESEPEAPQAEATVESPERYDTLEDLPRAFAPLPTTEHQLTEERAQLERAAGFRIMYHQAWVQPVPGRDEVVPIKIQAGETYGQNQELQGYLDLYVERYLHLTADLQLVRYTQTDNPFRLIDEEESSGSVVSEGLDSFAGLKLDSDETTLDDAFVSQSDNRYFVATKSIRMSEKRRMRSEVLHYLDNPEFGLLFLVTPIELENEQDQG